MQSKYQRYNVSNTNIIADNWKITIKDVGSVMMKQNRRSPLNINSMNEKRIRVKDRKIENQIILNYYWTLRHWTILKWKNKRDTGAQLKMNEMLQSNPRLQLIRKEKNKKYIERKILKIVDATKTTI